MISFGDAAIAQSVVRNIGSVEVTGSIPVSSLKKEYPFGYSFFSVIRISWKRVPNLYPIRVLWGLSVLQPQPQRAAAFQASAAGGLLEHLAPT